MKNKPELTTKDHKNMDAFLGHVLDDYKDGVINKRTSHRRPCSYYGSA
ncbi:MAG: hypothetical protein AB2809_17065 [Candidatus Thiodiazotropha sp.]